MELTSAKIAIIGGGNIGSAIARGLLTNEKFKPENLMVTRRKPETLHSLKEEGVQVHSNNLQAAAEADIVILAVKPFKLLTVLKELQPSLQADRQILVSAATGITLDELQKVAGTEFPVFRAMPNTAIAVRESMTCIASGKYATEEQEQLITGLFNNLGEAVCINEELMDAATVLAACGIAYALRFIRANMQGGIEIGFDSQTANLIATQTVKGASELLLKGGQHPESEIDKVTTPQGCTIAGLNEMEHQGFSSSLIKGIMTSFQKIEKDFEKSSASNIDVEAVLKGRKN